MGKIKCIQFKREQAEQNLKDRCELFRQTRAFLNQQLEDKKRAAQIEYEERKEEELKLAEKLREEVRLEKQKGILS
jgi:hypothetical protein